MNIPLLCARRRAKIEADYAAALAEAEELTGTSRHLATTEAIARRERELAKVEKLER